jgi:hypothetical protein
MEWPMHEKPKLLGAAGGAVGLSTLALAFGACCVSPWAVTLLGVGGAVLFARLTVLQPYLVVTTLPLVGLSFWYAYRRIPLPADGACPADNRTTLRWIVWLEAFLVIAIDLASFAPRFLSLS